MGLIKLRKEKRWYKSKKFHPFTKLMSYLMEIGEFDNYNRNAKKSSCPDNNHPQILGNEDYRDRSCRELLIISFNFKDTPEGGNYWQKIYNKVEANLDRDRY